MTQHGRSHRDTSLDNRAPLDEHHPDHPRPPAETDSPDGEISEPDRIYDTLPDSAWQLDHDQSAANEDRAPMTAPNARETVSSGPHPWRQTNRPSVRYRTAYECSVCRGVHELDTSLRVCAFVNECGTCGTVARFTAVGVPTRPTRIRVMLLWRRSLVWHRALSRTVSSFPGVRDAS